MTNRNPLVVILLTIVTLGLYEIYWLIVTASELRTKGAEIPHWILLFIPFAAIYWLYKFSLGIEKVTGGKTSGTLTFLLFWFIAIAGLYVAQAAFNELDATAAPAVNNYNNGVTGSPAAPQQSMAPDPAVAAAAGATFVAAPQTDQVATSPDPAVLAQVPIESEQPAPQPFEAAVIQPTPMPAQPQEFVAPTPEVFTPAEPAVIAPESQAVEPTFQPQQPVVQVEETPVTPLPPQA